MTAELPLTPGRRHLALLTLGALGVVFGDLGTSPLYALQECFVGPHAIRAVPADVYGAISLFIWSLVVVVCLKYVVIIMRADNRGEGGILALLAMALGGRRTSEQRENPPRRIPLILG